MALTDSIGAVVGGLLGKGPVSAPDLSALFQTIDQAGEQQKDWINALPADLQKQYADYKASNSATADALKTSIAGNNANLMTQTQANFDPNAPAVKAAEDAAKTAIYANVPGQQAAIRQALASTGGFGRGTAAKQLAAPVLAAGTNLNTAIAGITTQQLQQKQTATQKAIETINSVDDQTANTLFGMSKDQALQILQGNRQDLKDQLSSLVNQSINQTNQKLGVEGANITNQYNQKVAQNAKDNAQLNGWVNLGTDLVAGAPGFLQGLNSGTTTGSYNPNAPQYENQLPG